MIYMLDTNICGYIIRSKPQEVRQKLKSIETSERIALSSIVVSELLYGARKKGNEALANIVLQFVANFEICNFDERAAFEYANIRTTLEATGNIIGSNDLFIAAHAKSIGAVLVTNNTREFDRVGGLNVENWVQDRQT